MSILNLLLSGSTLMFIVGVVSLGIVVRALTRFGGESADLRARLRRIEQELERMREKLPEKRHALQAMREVVQPLKQLHTQMQSHYDRLCLIERKALEAEKESQPHEDEDIQMHRPGSPHL